MLEVVDMTVSYGPVEAVRDLSLKVHKGTVVTLIGPNGAGKTTTLNALSGLIPLRAGRVLLNGRDISKMRSHRRVSEGIMQVPEGRQVLAGMTVRENLELGGYRRPRGEMTMDLARMEKRFPILGERRNALAGTLSGGEQQMLAIARGLMARPRLLLLDEPSLGLAPLLVRTIFDIIRELLDEGLTILLVEQNARQALAVSNHAYVMESGSVVIEGPAEQLQSDPAIIQTYLGKPAGERAAHLSGSP
jgi:branched-chain amino acid transport system ATP-binding protein